MSLSDLVRPLGTPARARIGVVSLYFPFFDAQMPAGFRASREEVAASYARALEDSFDVVYAGMLCDDADGRAANTLLKGHDLDAIVVAPAMAAPPNPVIAALENLDLPTLIWNAPLIAELPADMAQREATINTTPVACVMLANALLRRRCRFSVVTARFGDPDEMAELRRTLRGLAAAGQLRGAAALRLGDSMPGYYDVEASAAQLAELGVREKSVSRDELDAAYDEVSPEKGSELLETILRHGWGHRPGASDVASARLALAISNVARRHRARFGTVNCHGEFFRRNPAIGITACLGVSLLSAAGTPFSCTGDQPAALALRLAKTLTGKALYCEFYSAESSTGLMLLAAGGEGDYLWAGDAVPVIEPNDHYPGLEGNGASLSFALEPGPATILSLSPLDEGWRLAWATGQIGESRYPRMGGPNAMFRFDSGHSRDVGSNWIESGASHHQALAPGRLDLEIPVMARALGVEAIRV